MQSRFPEILKSGDQILSLNFTTMKLSGVFVILSFVLFALPACQVVQCGPTKDSFIEKYEAFITKVEDKDLDLDDSQWEKLDETFRNYVEDCYEYHESEMSAGERRKFWMNSLKYYAARYGEGMIHMLNRDNDITSERVKKNIEEVMDATGKELEDFIDKNADELEALFEEIGKDIEDWAAKFKEIFEE